MRGAALFLSLWVAAVASAAGPDTGRPDPERPDAGAAPVHVWDVPGAIEAVDVPGRSVGFGVPVAMHAVRSRERSDVLAADLARQFRAAGLFIPPKGQVRPSSDMLQITALDPDTFVAYTAFLQENPDRTTTVILTESYLAERERPERSADFAPIMPGARGLLVTHTEGTELANYRVQAAPAAIDAFYREALAKAGYAKVREGLYRHGTDLLRLSFRKGEPGETEILVLHRKAAEPDQALEGKDGGSDP